MTINNINVLSNNGLCKRDPIKLHHLKLFPTVRVEWSKLHRKIRGYVQIPPRQNRKK